MAPGEFFLFGEDHRSSEPELQTAALADPSTCRWSPNLQIAVRFATVPLVGGAVVAGVIIICRPDWDSVRCWDSWVIC